MADPIHIRRVIRAPRPRVFTAGTTPEHLQQWWGPGAVTCPEAEIDLREGGHYRIANLQEDGRTVWIEGSFERVTRPDELVYSSTIGGAPESPTRVTVLFRDHDEGTELDLTHELIPDDDLRQNHLEGWNACLDGLETYLAA